MAARSLYDELERWRNREQNVARLFSEEALRTPYYLKSRLDHFRQLNAIYSQDKSLQKDVGLKVLQGEIRTMERRLYPNPLERIARRAIAQVAHYFGPDRLLERERIKIEEARQSQQIERTLQVEKETPAQRYEQTVSAALLTPKTRVASNETKEELRNEQLFEKALQADRERTQAEYDLLMKKEMQQVTSANIPHLKMDSGSSNTQIDSFQTKILDMNDKNYDYLSSQLKYTGFGEDLQAQLKEKLQKQEPEFMLTHQKSYGNDVTAATLHFKKSTTSDMYFFNKYSLHLQNPQHPDPIKQTFYLNPDEKAITLKEGYNLLSGRAVYKERSDREGQGYNAWMQLDFKQTDKNGNYKIQLYNDKYGFNLDQSLNRHAIKELQDPTQKERLMESLQRGNRHTVNITINGQEKQMAIEAAPRFKNLNFFETNGIKVRADKLYQSAAPDQSQKQEVKKTQKQGAGGDEGDGGVPDQQQTKKRRTKQSL